MISVRKSCLTVLLTKEHTGVFAVKYLLDFIYLLFHLFPDYLCCLIYRSERILSSVFTVSKGDRLVRYSLCEQGGEFLLRVHFWNIQIFRTKCSAVISLWTSDVKWMYLYVRVTKFSEAKPVEHLEERSRKSVHHREYIVHVSEWLGFQESSQTVWQSGKPPYTEFKLSYNAFQSVPIAVCNSKPCIEENGVR